MAENNPGAPGQHGRKSDIFYKGAKVYEGSLLYRTFEKLARLPEADIAKIGSMIDLFYGAEGNNDRLSKMQERIDRLEKAVGGQPSQAAPVSQAVALPEPQAAPSELSTELAPTGKKRSRKKSGRKKDTIPGQSAIVKELEDELSETVEQRQARMAKMEKQERMKEAAFKKLWEKQKEAEKDAARDNTGAEAGPAAEAGEQADMAEPGKSEPKKKPRRRRKPAKKDAAESTEA